jgi:hypothetical protein
MQQYWDNMGYDYSGLSSDQIRILLIKSTKILDGQFASRWPGVRKSENQALQWPRIKGIYPDGYNIPDDKIPKEIEQAVLEMAYVINSGVDVTPIDTNPGDIKSELVRVEGAVTEDIEYRAGAGKTHVRIPLVLDALRPLLGNIGNYGGMKLVRV